MVGIGVEGERGSAGLGAGCGIVGKACPTCGGYPPHVCLAAPGADFVSYMIPGLRRDMAQGGSIVVASRAVDTALSTMKQSPKLLEYM